MAPDLLCQLLDRLFDHSLRKALVLRQAFEAEPHLLLLREMLRQVFATPVKHAKSKPFFDHVISFHVADGRVWIRNYQVRL